MKITGYTVEKLKDPTGILIGDRFEFFLDLEVDEDDELFSENGVQLRVLFYRYEDDSRILNYYFLSSEQILDFAIDEEEEKTITQFCNEHLSEIDEE
ncbi:DUF6509 family protein [Cytobacillus dafuensis]|uniref:Pullulanase n=1 Tax=Cytobacillus dafuensis TaxID=1742359 RepID=A0A5B8Z5L8_CYTDA|nr:DUF6509 family protein [Cytobacillus dafuensis]QED48251.1 pullulanase [Cytobacillus dafuensis]